MRLTGATPTARSGDGDVVLGGRVIEIKEGGGGTVNQVRPYKCLTLVVRDSQRHHWYVVPWTDVIRSVRGRIGQHTRNPFICVSIGLNDIMSRYPALGDDDLLFAVERAILVEDHELRDSMIRLARMEELVVKWIERQVA